MISTIQNKTNKLNKNDRFVLLGTPNGHKISIALEEMGLEYQVFPINILENDQFQPDFYAFHPTIKSLRLWIKMVLKGEAISVFLSQGDFAVFRA